MSVNETPPRPWDPEPQNNLKFRLRPDRKVLFNSQIVREVPLTTATNTMNDQFHVVLGNSCVEALHPDRNAVAERFALHGRCGPGGQCSRSRSPISTSSRT